MGGGLEETAGRAEADAHEQGGERARKAYVHDGRPDLRVGAGGGVTEKEVPGAAHRALTGTDDEGEQHKDRERKRKSRGGPEG